MQWLQDPDQSNLENLRPVDISGGGDLKLLNLKQETNSKKTNTRESVTLGSGTCLELT